MQMRNYMEDLVWQNLPELLEQRPKVCSCEHCRYDIAAIALNNLKPKYVATRQGEAYTRIHTLEAQFNVDVIAAIIQAMQIVETHPHHSIEEGSK